MNDNIEATIYLSDQRGYSNLDGFRSFHCFNFGHYFDENRKPFGALQVLNDDELIAQKNLSMTLESDTEVFLLPITGGLEYSDSLGNHHFVMTNQALNLTSTKGVSYTISNPYEVETINFLQVWIKNNREATPTHVHNIEFNLNKNNQLWPVSHSKSFKALIGKYNGRKNDIYTVHKHNSIFVFVVSGAFEVQNRLLHARDGLSLKNVKTIEFESLSNDAVLLILEIFE